jgi:ribonuclease HI
VRVALPELAIYTDGACSGNGRRDARGGWAAVLAAPEGEPRQLSGGETPSTNQRMELMAAIQGLRAVPEPRRVTLYADSAYLVNGMTQRWYLKWRRNGWINSKKEPVANRELWEALVDLVENHGHEITFAKVKGHAERTKGHVASEHERFNQLCDQLAVAAIAAAAA